MTVYFVNHAGEDGTNGHNGSTEALAWRTLAYAEDQLVAGDTVYVKADEAYTDADGENGCVLYVEKIGTTALPITFEGYKATPGDGDDFADGSGRFEIDATGKTYGISAPAVSTSRYRSFRNCYVHGASSTGINFQYVNYSWFYFVKLATNGGVGIQLRANSIIKSCISVNNGSSGFVINQTTLLTNSLSSGNSTYACISENANNVISDCVLRTTSGSNIILLAQRAFIISDCVISGSGSSAHGLKYYSGSSLDTYFIQNCIFVNVVKGIELYPGANNNTNFMSNNCFFNVTTPYTNCVSSGGDVLADPLFVDAANGDFHLRAGSPCIGAGVNGSDIGAYGYASARFFGIQAVS